MENLGSPLSPTPPAKESQSKSPSSETKTKVETWEGRKIEHQKENEVSEKIPPIATLPSPPSQQIPRQISVVSSLYNWASKGIEYVVKQSIAAFVRPSDAYYNAQEDRFNTLTKDHPEWAQAMDETKSLISGKISEKLDKKEAQGLINQLKRIVASEPSMLEPTIESLLKEVFSNIATYTSAANSLHNVSQEELLNHLASQLFLIGMNAATDLEKLETIQNPQEKEEALRKFFNSFAEDLFKVIVHRAPTDPDLVFIVKSALHSKAIAPTKDGLGIVPKAFLSLYKLYETGTSAELLELNKHPELIELLNKGLLRVEKKIQSITAPDSPPLVKGTLFSAEMKTLLDQNLKEFLKGYATSDKTNPSIFWNKIQTFIVQAASHLLDTVLTPDSPTQTSEQKVADLLSALLIHGQGNLKALLEFDNNPEKQILLMEDLVKNNDKGLCPNGRTLKECWDEIQLIEDPFQKSQKMEALFFDYVLFSWTDDLLDVVLEETGLQYLLPSEILQNPKLLAPIKKKLMSLLSIGYQNARALDAATNKAKAHIETIPNGPNLSEETSTFIKNRIHVFLSNPKSDIAKKNPYILSVLNETLSGEETNSAQIIDQAIDSSSEFLVDLVLSRFNQLHEDPDFLIHFIEGSLQTLEAHWSPKVQTNEAQKSLEMAIASDQMMFYKTVVGRLLYVLFPQGAENLPIAKAYQEKVWEKIVDLLLIRIQTQVANFEDVEKRDLFLLEVLNKQKFKLIQSLEDAGIPYTLRSPKLENVTKIEAILIRDICHVVYLQALLELKKASTEETKEKTSASPIQFLKAKVTSAVSSAKADIAFTAAEHFGKKIMKLFHDPSFNILFRKLLWASLDMIASNSFTSEQLSNASKEETKKMMSESLKHIMKDTDLVPTVVAMPVASFVSKKMIDKLAGKTVLNLILEVLTKVNIKSLEKPEEEELKAS